MYTLLLIAVLWVALAVPVALLIGRGLRDRRPVVTRLARNEPAYSDFLPADAWRPIPSRPDAA